MKLSEQDIHQLDKDLSMEDENKVIEHEEGSTDQPNAELHSDESSFDDHEYEKHEHNDEDEAPYQDNFFEQFMENKEKYDKEFEEFMEIDDDYEFVAAPEIDETVFKGKGRNVNAVQREQAIMTDVTYLKERLEAQMNWFDRKSSYNQRRYKRIKHIEFIIAASIPVVITFAAMGFVEKTVLYSFGAGPDAVTVTMSIFFQVLAAIGGVVLVIFNKNLELEQYFKHWKEYRSIAEALQYERMRYLTRTEPYDEGDAYPHLVERVEMLLNKENLRWAQEKQDVKSKNKAQEKDN